MKTVYQTIDGEIFSAAAKALTHEKDLFTAWLNTDAVAPYRELLEGLDGKRENEHYGSDRSLARIFLQVFWSKLP